MPTLRCSNAIRAIPHSNSRESASIGLPVLDYGIVPWLSKLTTSMFGSGLALTLITIG